MEINDPPWYDDNDPQPRPHVPQPYPYPPSVVEQGLPEKQERQFDIDRANSLAVAERQSDGKWKKHTAFHWSRIVLGKKLDYWPSREKYMYDGRVHIGNVMSFIHQLQGHS